MYSTNTEMVIGSREANCIYSLIDTISKSKPDAFTKQAGDMANLASTLSRTIYSSIKYRWTNPPQSKRGTRLEDHEDGSSGQSGQSGQDGSSDQSGEYRFEDNAVLILTGFNAYLKQKGIALVNKTEASAE